MTLVLATALMRPNERKRERKSDFGREEVILKGSLLAHQVWLKWAVESSRRVGTGEEHCRCSGPQMKDTHTHAHAHAQRHTHAHTHTRTHTHTHAHTHTCTHTHTHTHARTHAHIHTFLWFTGTLHRRNGFCTVQTVCAIALHLPYT